MNFSYIVFAFVWPIRTSKVNLPRLPERKGGKTKTGNKNLLLIRIKKKLKSCDLKYRCA